MTLAAATLLAGIACAAVGGEFFLRGIVAIGRRVRLSGAAIGATLAAFATSSPEFFVGVSSAFAGRPQLSLGDCLGSNVVNITIVLGGALLFGPLGYTKQARSWDLPVAIVLPFLLSVLLADGLLSRWDGVFLLVAFAIWIKQATSREPQAPGRVDSLPAGRSWASACAGLVGLILGARWVVLGAMDIAGYLGWSPFLVGSIVVAVGTSVPEIATTWIARYRGRDDISVGTILGSNIFNSTFILGVVALVAPIPVNGPAPWISLSFAALASLIIWPFRNEQLGAKRAILLAPLFVWHAWASWTTST